MTGESRAADLDSFDCQTVNSVFSAPSSNFGSMGCRWRDMARKRIPKADRVTRNRYLTQTGSLGDYDEIRGSLLNESVGCADNPAT